MKILSARSVLRRTSRAIQTLAGGALLFAFAATPGLLQAQVTLFGAPSNFDVLNDTGQDAHGFEIELQGVNRADLSGVWQASRFPYTVLTIPGGIVIHYASPYVAGQYTITTITPAVFNPTLGHSCVVGMIAGCEHYGYYFAYYSLQPTKTIYRWLVDDPQNPGSLIPAPSQIVQIPGAPPAPPQIVQIPAIRVILIPPAQPAAAPAVAFEFPVEPPPPPPIPKPDLQFGVATWAKVLINEVQHNVVVDDLLEDNPVVPNDANPAQVETAWKLLQFNPHSANSGVFHSQKPLGLGAKAVIRKYELNKDSGPLDPASGKALCGGNGLCTAPLPGELGDFIGNQMAAANLGASSVTVTRVGTGSGTVTGTSINCGGSCTAPLALGTAVTLTAKPDSNATFGGWTGDCAGAQVTCTFSISGENNVAANFVLVAAGGGGGSTAGFKISVSLNGNGTVTANPAAQSYAAGTVVTLTATPKTGSPWVGWGGACSGTATTCTLTMDANKSVTANFR